MSFNQLMEYQVIKILGSVKNIFNFYFEKKGAYAVVYLALNEKKQIALLPSNN